MKNYFYVLIILVFFFSCKKQKLKDEKEVFIGEWEWIMSLYIYHNKLPGCDVDTIYPNVCKSIIFKKNGKVIFNDNKEVVEYKMNFRENKTDEDPYFSKKLSKEYFICPDDSVGFMGKSKGFRANFHFGLGKKNSVPVNGSINENWLRLDNNRGNLIGGYRSYVNHNYYHYLKRK